MRCQQISVFLENRKGSLAAVCRILGAGGLNLLALSIAETDSYGICRIIVSDTQEGVKLLRAAGYTVRLSDVLVVCVPDKPNGLGDVLHILEHEDISVEYLYSFVRNSGFDALIIFKVSDIERSEEVLSAARIRLLSKEQVEKL